MGTLYIVSTPIGNLKDITLRALEVLWSVDVIACEDTRRTGLLLKLLPDQSQKIPGPLLTQDFAATQQAQNDNLNRALLLSYHEHNEHLRIQQILNLLHNDQNVALVSDAGTPTISDPGFKLVRECRQQGFPVVSVPGANAALSALSVSGLPTDKFMFLGYLPHKEGKRITLLTNVRDVIATVNQTVVIYEAPHKLIKTLTNLKEVFGNMQIVLARELTKVHEEIENISIDDALQKYSKVAPKGEFVILFHPEEL